jgi:hypothetical protein
MRMFIARARLLALLAGVAAAIASQAATADCLRYEGASVVITGILEQNTYPGRPASQGAPAAAADTDYYLRLRAAACAVAGSKGSPDVEARKGVWLVQLVPDSSAESLLRPRLGRSIHVRGRLFSSHTERHHAPLVLQFMALEDER